MSKKRRPAAALKCKCGTTVIIGHIDGTKILCDDCWTRRQQSESANYPAWRGNNVKEGQVDR
jgi:hypothetical protein